MDSFRVTNIRGLHESEEFLGCKDFQGSKLGKTLATWNDLLIIHMTKGRGFSLFVCFFLPGSRAIFPLRVIGIVLFLYLVGHLNGQMV